MSDDRLQVPATISEVEADVLGMPVSFYERAVRFGASRCPASPQGAQEGETPIADELSGMCRLSGFERDSRYAKAVLKVADLERRLRVGARDVAPQEETVIAGSGAETGKPASVSLGDNIVAGLREAAEPVREPPLQSHPASAAPTQRSAMPEEPKWSWLRDYVAVGQIESRMETELDAAWRYMQALRTHASSLAEQVERLKKQSWERSEGWDKALERAESAERLAQKMAAALEAVREIADIHRGWCEYCHGEEKNCLAGTWDMCVLKKHSVIIALAKDRT